MGTDTATDGDMDMVKAGPVFVVTGASMQMMTDHDMATDLEEDGDGEETKAMMEVSDMVSPMPDMTAGTSITPADGEDRRHQMTPGDDSFPEMTDTKTPMDLD